MQATLANAVAVYDGQPCTTSLKVAEVFGKRHDHVLRAIKEMAAPNFGGSEIPADFAQLNFKRGTYLDANQQERPMFHITRDGFTLLAMGFTGKAAMRFKVAYIEAFNAMEKELRDIAADIHTSVPVPASAAPRRKSRRVKIADAVDMLNRVSFRIQRLAAVVCPDIPFSVPSGPDEVADFCRFAGLTNVNPVKFFNYYESRRWRINGVLITDWQSVCRSWQYNDMEWRAISCDNTVAGGR